MELDCPQCGAGLPLDPFRSFLGCPYCGSSHYIELEASLRHYLVRPIIREEAARAALPGWLAGRRIKRSVTVRSTELAYIPFWQIASGLTAYAIPAASLTFFEGQDIFEIKGDLRFFSPEAIGEGADVLDPDLFLEGALERLRDLGHPAGEGTEIRLIHVPFFRLTYDAGGESYTALVDGLWGRVYGEPPPPAVAHAEGRSFAAVFGVLTALFAIEGALLPGPGWIAAAYLSTSLLGYGLAKGLLGRSGGATGG